MSDGTKHTVLIVDDDPNILRAHASFIRALGYDVETASDGIEALGKLPLDIDLVLLDGEMPAMDGFEVAERIRGMADYAHLPIVMVTGLTRPQDRRRALEVGINDFINKPVDPEELILRARWLLELKSAHDRLREHDAELERTVERKTESLRRALSETIEAKRQIHEAHLDTIRRLTIAAEYKDQDTAGHIERIGLYSEVMARSAGLSPGEVETIRHAAPMHDVGKIGTPDHILLKPGRLDSDEWTIMRSHATMGGRILTGSTSSVLRMGEQIALAHHEKWDGSGYPNGIKGEAIPFVARICAVVDFYDALTMDRPYREALPSDQVVDMMREVDGTHFDPGMLDLFLSVLAEIREIQTAYQ